MRRAWDRVMLAHRQYTSGYGDALAGSLTYALLVCVGPAVLLASTMAGWLHLPWSQGALRDAADAHLPAEVSGYLDALPDPGLPVTVGLTVALVWTSLRLVRALRTSIRSMCGQPAGSGNPVRDALRDAALGLLLLAVVSSAVVVVAASRATWWSLPVATLTTTALFAGIMLRGSWPGPGRPGAAAALRAAFVAALVVDALSLVARFYVDTTAEIHDQLYRTASGLVAALVWSSLVCRTLLRATAWAATAVPATATATIGTATIGTATAGTASGPSGHSLESLWVVVPALNEADRITGTLRALAEQTDLGFQLVVVDNGSTDGTAEVVRAFALTAPFPVDVVLEHEPGAGTAADTGFRAAIAGGATAMLRTDADCLPADDWVAQARAALRAGAEMICGRSVPRADEQPSALERWALPAVTRGLAVYGRYRAAHLDPKYRTPYVLCHGHNLVITADLYLRCGGTPREPLQAGSEDVTLLNRAREHSDRVVRDESLVVQNSLRRLRAWGVRRTLLWHWDRRYVPEHESGVHVR